MEAFMPDQKSSENKQQNNQSSTPKPKFTDEQLRAAVHKAGKLALEAGRLAAEQDNPPAPEKK